MENLNVERDRRCSRRSEIIYQILKSFLLFIFMNICHIIVFYIKKNFHLVHYKVFDENIIIKQFLNFLFINKLLILEFIYSLIN